MGRLCAALFLVLAPVLANGQDAPIPPGVKIVEADALKAMLDGKGAMVLVNSLSPLEFTQTKISGSVNLPYGQLRDGKVKLPADRGTPLVFYCLGPK